MKAASALLNNGSTKPKRICLVTTGHPSTNPRLVKEADALSSAGYAVRVVACKFVTWADAADAEFADRAWWPVTWVRFGPFGSSAAWTKMRCRKKACEFLVAGVGFRPILVERALHYVVPELTRAASAEPADLYIAHNLAALPAAAHAAARHRARLGFDAEDFHRGELPESERHALRASLTRWAEGRYIPLCDYVTAASEGIANAYAKALSIPRPVTVLNVFPLADRETGLDGNALETEKAPGTRTLYWFSQTIGPGRGLESALAALVELEDDVHLALRGAWSNGYEEEFMMRADALKVRHRVRALAPVSPGELVVRAASHDVGLALELPETLSHDLCVSNKIFTYLLAGLPTIASATCGQREICEAVPRATRVVPPGSASALAAAARDLLGDANARSAARAAATDRFNWDLEKDRLLALVSQLTWI